MTLHYRPHILPTGLTDPVTIPAMTSVTVHITTFAARIIGLEIEVRSSY